MEIETITTQKIIASEGHILTDGEIYGSVIFLANDRNPDEFYEITQEEYDEIMKSNRPLNEDAI